VRSANPATHYTVTVGSNAQMKGTTITLLIILTLLADETVGQGRTKLLGIATDGHRNRLLGINVMIKGTSTGTVTDICGRFAIPLESEKFTLVFHGMSYDDMRTYEIELKKSKVRTDTIVFQLGHRKVQNTECDKVDKRLKKRVID
jgi:hypothetical protein